MTKLVLSFISSSRAASILVSVSTSTALVLSSRMSITGFMRRARAMATLCFWPPLRFTPL